MIGLQANCNAEISYNSNRIINEKRRFQLKKESIEMYKVVLLRHGESVWNKENLFTGWTDVDLSEKGREEATQAGRMLKEQGYHFDIAFTSVLKRAIRTLWITLDEMDLMWIPVERDWRLNERHYGALQGLNKAETAAKYGEEPSENLAPQLRHSPAGAGRG